VSGLRSVQCADAVSPRINLASQECDKIDHTDSVGLTVIFQAGRKFFSADYSTRSVERISGEAWMCAEKWWLLQMADL